jgi:hypothetical protein
MVVSEHKVGLAKFVNGEAKLDLIKLLISLEYKIIILEDGSIYIYTAFVPANNKSYEQHTIEGKEVTYLKALPTDKDAVVSELSKIKELVYWVHRDIKYINIFKKY